MNSRTFNRLVEISKALKPRRQTGRAFITSFALRKNKISCISWNDYNKRHLEHKFGKYHNYKNLPGEYIASQHSESKLLIRLGEEDLSDYDICNIRINNNNDISLSCPCLNCQKLLAGYNPKAIYYSTVNGFEKL